MESEQYQSNCMLNPKYVGTDVLTTIPKSVSTPRLTLNSKVNSQSVLFNSVEPPRMFTGYETQFGCYTFEASPIQEEVIILRLVKKFNTDPVAVYSVPTTPTTTVFYRSIATGKLGHFDLYDYRVLSPGFGYEVHHVNTELLKEGTRVQPGTVFNRSLADRTKAYAMGTNVKVAYVGLTDNTEDAIGISESLAKRLTRTCFHESNINLGEDKIGVRLFDSEYQYKFFPDIGEVVTPEGILMATRNYNVNGLFEYTDRNLRKIKVGDYKYKVPRGSVVRDVNVWLSPRKLKEKEKQFKDPESPLHQLYKYHYHKLNYYFACLQMYAEYHNRYELMDFTHNLMLEALTYCALHDSTTLCSIGHCFGTLKHIKPNSAVSTLYDKKDSIDFAYLRITTSVEVKAQAGTKLTNRYGNKGVVSNIWPSNDGSFEVTHVIPDDHRPVDQEGFVCDLVMSPDSPPNRLNPEQLAELSYLRLADLVVMDSSTWDIDNAYNYIVDFITTFNRNYGALIDEMYHYRKDVFVDHCRNKGIYLHNHLSLEERTPENDLLMFKKFNYRESPITFKREVAPGVVKTITTKNPVAIGDQYILMLNKDPLPSATELGYVNHHKLPMKNTNAKTTVAYTPIRCGEQETYRLSQAVIMEVINRLYCLSGQSPEHAQAMLLDTLRTHSPSAYMQYDVSTDDIMLGNVSLNILRHVFASAGVDISPEAFYMEDN